MKRNMLAAVTAVFLSCASAYAAADRTPDATIDLSGGSVAVGVGVDWSKGTLHFKGQDVPVKVKGLSLLRVGVSKISASGEVYNQHVVSAAHRTLPLPSLVRVTNLENGRQAGIDIEAYLIDLLTRLPAHSIRRLGDWLPRAWQRARADGITP